MNSIPLSLSICACLAGAAFGSAALEVTAVNPLGFSRPSQTIGISAKDLAPLGEEDLTKVHVVDSKGGECVCQAVDVDGDELRKPDEVIFQADFAPEETRRFTVKAGPKQVFRKEQFKVFGRFVRERFDDFAWENDKIAHRTYGKALETWKGEPLTSSTIDIWSKRTPRLVVNDWYLTDDYHADHGEGADFYSAGRSRGCGGSGLWADGAMWVSANFEKSRTLANGPIRVMFELEYSSYDVSGESVSEVKRVTLDAGQHFDRYQSFYGARGAGSLATAVGLKKVKGEELMNGTGWLAKWEPMDKRAGHQGLAVIVTPDDYGQTAEAELDHLVVMKPTKSRTAGWWAGFCWDKAGEFTTAEMWRKHVDEFSQGLAAPIRVSVKPAR